MNLEVENKNKSIILRMMQDNYFYNDEGFKKFEHFYNNPEERLNPELYNALKENPDLRMRFPIDINGPLQDFIIDNDPAYIAFRDLIFDGPINTTDLDKDIIKIFLEMKNFGKRKMYDAFSSNSFSFENRKYKTSKFIKKLFSTNWNFFFNQEEIKIYNEIVESVRAKFLESDAKEIRLKDRKKLYSNARVLPIRIENELFYFKMDNKDVILSRDLNSDDLIKMSEENFTRSVFVNNKIYTFGTNKFYDLKKEEMVDYEREFIFEFDKTNSLSRIYVRTDEKEELPGTIFDIENKKMIKNFPDHIEEIDINISGRFDYSVLYSNFDYSYVSEKFKKIGRNSFIIKSTEEPLFLHFFNEDENTQSFITIDANRARYLANDFTEKHSNDFFWILEKKDASIQKYIRYKRNIDGRSLQIGLENISYDASKRSSLYNYSYKISVEDGSYLVPFVFSFYYQNGNTKTEFFASDDPKLMDIIFNPNYYNWIKIYLDKKNERFLIYNSNNEYYEVEYEEINRDYSKVNKDIRNILDSPDFININFLERVELAMGRFIEENKISFKKNKKTITKKGAHLFDVQIAKKRLEGDKFSDEEIDGIITDYLYDNIYSKKVSMAKYEFVISANFADFFLSSTSESWKSCLSLESSTMYWSGLPMLMFDPNRLIAYITDGKKKEYYGIETDRFVQRSFIIQMADSDPKFPSDYMNQNYFNFFELSKPKMFVQNVYPGKSESNKDFFYEFIKSTDIFNTATERNLKVKSPIPFVSINSSYNFMPFIYVDNMTPFIDKNKISFYISYNSQKVGFGKVSGNQVVILEENQVRFSKKFESFAEVIDTSRILGTRITAPDSLLSSKKNKKNKNYVDANLLSFMDHDFSEDEDEDEDEDEEGWDEN